MTQLIGMALSQAQQDVLRRVLEWGRSSGEFQELVITIEPVGLTKATHGEWLDLAYACDVWVAVQCRVRAVANETDSVSKMLRDRCDGKAPPAEPVVKKRKQPSLFD